MAVDFDFDPFSHLDMNGDLEIDEQDLKLHELQEGYGYSIDDLNHDGVFDKFQNDLNSNFTIDNFEVDFDQNTVIDKYETFHTGSDFKVDLNNDGSVDETDAAMARFLLK